MSDMVSVCWQILICSSGLLAGQGLHVMSAFQWHCQGTNGPFALVCGHSEIKCNLTLAQFGEKLLQPCHTQFF